MKRVKLLKNVEVEHELLPAGTICEVEKAYEARDEQPAMVDLFDPATGALFWTLTDEVEAID